MAKDIHHGENDRPFAVPGGIMQLFLLALPCIFALWVPLYNSIPPVLFGIPFFFWFQLILIPISALAILAADRIGKS
jgi:Protein of unknown function (DUF3311)